jgi:adhesin transport system outer membrane protein
MAVVSTIAICSLLITGGASPVSAPTSEINTVSWISLIRDALADNPSVTSKRAMLESSNAGITTARWQFFPTPSANVEKVQQTNDAIYRGTKQISKFVVQQPLWTGGRLTANLDLAKAREVTALAELEMTRLQVAQKITEIYGDWFLANAKIKVIQFNIDALDKKMTLIQARIEQGMAAPIDRVFVVGRIEQLKSDLLSFQVQLRSAQTKMSQVLGREVKLQELALHTPIPSQVTKLSEDDLKTLAEQHPSVIRSEAQIKLQGAEIASAKADLQPDVYLKFDRQFGNYLYDNLGPQNHTFVGFNTRFGAGLSNRSIIASAMSKLESANLDQEQSKRLIFEQISTDLSSIQVMPARLQALQASMMASKDTLDSWERQYLVGKKTWQDIINTHRELLISSYAFHEAHTTWFVASWRFNMHAEGLEKILASSFPSNICSQ